MRGLLITGTLVGLVIGLAAGLYLAWVVWPISFVDADPADLRLDLKDDYQRMIAAAYSLDGDLPRAWARLGSLHLAQPGASVAELASRESKPKYQQALIHLALDLRQPAVALARPTYTPRPTKTPTRTGPAVTVLPRPTRTPTSTATPVETAAVEEPTGGPAISVPNPDAPRFHLADKASLTCAAVDGHAHIEVQVEDENGKPKPGVGIEVYSGNSDEVFYTGLRPERGLGYAELRVAKGSYSLRLAQTAQSEVVEKLDIQADAQPCLAESTEIYGWRLVFRPANNNE